MTDRPILFSGAMVRALLEGRKTQTRRMVAEGARCRFTPGDRLWVRETTILTPAGIAYAADGGAHYGAGVRLRATPAIHMQRVHSRLTLDVTAVRFERLIDISDADAIEEGVRLDPGRGWVVPGVEHPDLGFPFLSRPTAREMYAALWDVIHGSGAWCLNPRVAVISFSVERRNIDAGLAA